MNVGFMAPSDISDSLFYLARVGHDIQSPILAIESVVDASGVNVDSARIEVLKQSVKRLKAISFDLREYYRKKSVALPDFLEADLFLEDLKQVVIEKEIQKKDHQKIDLNLVAKNEKDLEGKFLRIARSEWQRVFSNLLQNSIEACAKKMESQDEYFGNIETVVSSNAHAIKMKIEDNGIGMSPRELGYVTRPPRNSAKGPNHLGIGLYSAAKLIEGWGGAISIDSKIGSGTKITIVLPLRNS